MTDLRPPATVAGDPALASVLAQALPYFQRFHGETFVVKYGGSAMKDAGAMASVIRNVVLLQLVGIRPILVHGGGPEIDALLGKLGIEKRTVRGLRVTDDATMDAVEMALLRANKALVGEFQRAGAQAIGLSGRDSDLLIAEVTDPELGRVGTITHVSGDLLRVTTSNGYVPVICSVATDRDRRPLNVNADLAAAAIAIAVKARKLILLTDTNGVLADRNDPASTLPHLNAEEARAMIADGRADRGMIPKLEAALQALALGVPDVHLLNGGLENALLIEVFTDAGVGTMLGR